MYEAPPPASDLPAYAPRLRNLLWCGAIVLPLSWVAMALLSASLWQMGDPWRENEGRFFTLTTCSGPLLCLIDVPLILFLAYALERRLPPLALLGAGTACILPLLCPVWIAFYRLAAIVRPESPTSHDLPPEAWSNALIAGCLASALATAATIALLLRMRRRSVS